MSYTPSPGATGPTFKSRVETGGVQLPTIECDEAVLNSITDEASSSITYVCEAPVGSAATAAVWRVKRIQVIGTVTTVQYAGTGNFDQVAANRATLSYP